MHERLVAKSYVYLRSTIATRLDSMADWPVTPPETQRLQAACRRGARGVILTGAEPVWMQTLCAHGLRSVIGGMEKY